MKSIKDINFKGRKVLVRVDFNVPMDENKNVTDDTRIRESLPTIEKLLNDGASVIIMAHFGRPKKGGFEPELTLKPVAEYLEKMINRPVQFTQALLGEGKVEEMAKNLKPGEVMLLENIRFYPGETKGDVALAEQLAKLGDCQVFPQRQIFRSPHGERGGQSGETHAQCSPSIYRHHWRQQGQQQDWHLGEPDRQSGQHDYHWRYALHFHQGYGW